MLHESTHPILTNHTVDGSADSVPGAGGGPSGVTGPDGTAGGYGLPEGALGGRVPRAVHAALAQLLV